MKIKTMVSAVFIVCCAGLFSQTAANSMFTLGKTVKAPVIDGTISKGEWDSATKIAGLVNCESEFTGRRYAEIGVAIDQTNIYFYCRSELPPKGIKLKSRINQNDGMVFTDDNVEMIVCPPAKDFVYHLILNRKGIAYDKKFPVINGSVTVEDIKDWTAGQKSASKTADGEWVLETSIPLASLGIKDGVKNGDEFRILAGRNWNNPFMQTTLIKCDNFVLPDKMAPFVYRPELPVISYLGAGKDWGQGKCDIQYTVFNSSGAPQDVAFRVDVTSDAAPRQVDGVKKIQPDSVEKIQLAFEENNLVARNLKAVFKDAKTGIVLHQRAISWDPSDKTAWVNPQKKQHAEVEFSVYPYLKKVKVRFGNPAQPATQWKNAEFSIWRSNEKVLSVPGEKGKYGFENIISVDLKAGEYELKADLVDAAGKQVQMNKKFEIRNFPWENNNIGCDRIIIPPFKAISYKDGRTTRGTLTGYSFRDGFFDKVSAGSNENILSAPITLKINGETVRETSFRFTEKSKDRAKTESQLKWKGGTVTVNGELDYDGFYKFTMTFKNNGAQEINSAELVVPMKKDFAQLHHATCDRIRFNTCDVIPGKQGIVWQSSKTTRTAKLRGNFHPYIWFGDRENGLAWMCESDRYWSLDHNKDTQYMERTDDSVILHVSLVNKPAVWDKEFTITQAFQATPIKPQPEYRRRLTGRVQFPNSWCLSTLAGGKCWSGGIPYQLFSPINDDFSYLEYLRKGDFSKEKDEKFVEAFIQKNLPNQTQKQIQSMRTHLHRGIHFRNISKYAIPYLNARVARLDWVDYQTYMDEWWCSEYRAVNADEYNLTPVRSYQDMALYNIRNLLRAGLDGVYYDNVRDWANPDPVRGPAWRMEDGTIQPYFDIFDTREFMKRTAILLVQEKKVFPDGRPVFTNHMTNTNLVPFHSFASIALDLEAQYGSKDFQDRFSEGYLQACTIGTQTGAIPEILIEISGDLEWVNRTFLAVTLTYDLPFVMNCGGLTNIFFKTWRYLYSFGYSTPEVKVYPCWDAQNPAKTNCADWRLCSYVKESAKEAVVAVGSFGGDAKGTVTFPGAVKCFDAEYNALIPMENGTVNLSIKKHDFRLLKFITE